MIHRLWDKNIQLHPFLELIVAVMQICERHMYMWLQSNMHLYIGEHRSWSQSPNFFITNKWIPTLIMVWYFMNAHAQQFSLSCTPYYHVSSNSCSPREILIHRYYQNWAILANDIVIFPSPRVLNRLCLRNIFTPKNNTDAWMGTNKAGYLDRSIEKQTFISQYFNYTKHH